MEQKEPSYILSRALQDTDPKHSDFLDAFAYMVSAKEYAIRGEYLLLYIRKRPVFIPEFLFKWMLSKLLVVALFKK